MFSQTIAGCKLIENSCKLKEHNFCEHYFVRNICDTIHYITVLYRNDTIHYRYCIVPTLPDTLFDEHGNAGGKPSYQSYTKIEVACQNFRKTVLDWRRYNKELDWGFRNNLSEHDLPNQIARLNRMHRDISQIDDLMHVADGIHLIFRYQPLWTEDKMKRVAPVAVSILGVVRDLQKVCQTIEPPFSCTKSFCFFADTDCEAYVVPLDLGTNDMGAL